MGECNKRPVVPSSRVAVDTFAGRIQVEWEPDSAVTPLGQLPFFIEFLKVSGLYEAFVADCPLQYNSPNAPEVRDVLGTLFLSVLAGHKRYAHITTIRTDRVYWFWRLSKASVGSDVNIVFPLELEGRGSFSIGDNSPILENMRV